MLRLLNIFLLMVIASCTQVSSINMNRHQFGLTPSKIIWFQLAGFDEQQLAIYKFNNSASVSATSFEQSVCVGKMWNYNLYHLKPSAAHSFLSQMTGKKDIQGTCKDTGLNPIWSYLSTTGHTIGILEMGVEPDQSLLRLNECTEKNKFTSPAHFWVSSKEAFGKKSPFVFSNPVNMEEGEVYYDQTCQQNGQCFSDLQKNAGAIYDAIKKNSSHHLFIVRDFRLLGSLKQKNFTRTREILLDWDTTLKSFLNYAKNTDYLILVTSAESSLIDMPDEGKGWLEFDRHATGAKIARRQLMGTVLASGSRSENFCGFYEEAQVFERILSGPKQQGLEFKLINPFN